MAVLIASTAGASRRAQKGRVLRAGSLRVASDVAGTRRPIGRGMGGPTLSSHPQNSASVPRTPFAHSTDIFPFSSALETAAQVADSVLAARLFNRLARAGLADSARARREQPRFRIVAIDRGRDGDVQAAGARPAHVGGRVVVVEAIAATVLVVLVVLVLLVVLLGDVSVTIGGIRTSKVASHDSPSVRLDVAPDISTSIRSVYPRLATTGSCSTLPPVPDASSKATRGSRESRMFPLSRAIPKGVNVPV